MRVIPYVFALVLAGCGAAPLDEVDGPDLAWADEGEALQPALDCTDADTCVPGQVRPQCGAAMRQAAFGYESSQAFTVPRTGAYRFLRLNLRRLFQNATGSLRVRVVALSPGSDDPSAGSVLGEGILAGSLIPRTAGTVALRFTAPITLNAADAGEPRYALWFDVPSDRLAVGIGCSVERDPLVGLNAGWRKTRPSVAPPPFLRQNRDIAFAIGDSASGPGPCQAQAGAQCDDGNATSGDGCSATCTVETGWSCSAAGSACVDDNECAVSNGGCDVHATCTNTGGSRLCACVSGWTGDGLSCADVNECLVDNGGCHAHATCTNTDGGRTCACTGGWTGDGVTCGDPVPQPLWTLNDSYNLTTYPALGDDGNFYGRRNGNLVSVSSTTGAQNWANRPSGCNGFPGGDPSFNAGRIYGVGDWNECNNGRLAAYLASGTLGYDRGDCPGGGNTSPHPRHTPAIDASLNTLYFGSSVLCSVNLTTSANRWTLGGQRYIGYNGIAIASDGTICKTTVDGSTTTLCATSAGALRFTRSYGSWSGPTVGAIVTGDRLIVTEPTQVRMWALDGTELWVSTSLTGEPVEDAAGNLYGTSPTVGSVASIGSNGASRWSVSVGTVLSTVDFIGDNGVAYVRSGSKFLGLRTSDGATLWSIDAGATLSTGLVLGRGGRLYVGLTTGKRLLYDTAIDYAASAWPKVNGNRRNSRKTGDPATVKF